MSDYIYIIQSFKNGYFYIGSSIDPEKRLSKYHNKGKVKATKYLQPWKLVFKQKCKDLRHARQVEYKLKKFKSRKILLDIIKQGRCKLINN